MNAFRIPPIIFNGDKTTLVIIPPIFINTPNILNTGFNTFNNTPTISINGCNANII